MKIGYAKNFVKKIEVVTNYNFSGGHGKMADERGNPRETLRAFLLFDILRLVRQPR
jgi:hypothetical protein